jgi:hypothetical protein
LSAPRGFTPYRKVGEPGRFADWVRALKGKSGVYSIRDTALFGGLGEYLYIGESHTGRLYETLTRHFQTWTGPQSRTTYDRASVRVAVRICRKGAEDSAIEVQDALICQLAPRDNLEARCDLPPLDEVPF